MQQDDVVRAFADGPMQFDVEGGLFGEISAIVGRRHSAENVLDHRPVIRRSAAGGIFRRHRFHLAPVFEVVAGGFLVRRDQVEHGPRKDLADDVGDMGAAAVARDQQAARLQFLQRVAQDRPRHVEPAGKLALPGKPVACAENAFEDQSLDLMDHLVGRARMLDGGEDFFHDDASRCGGNLVRSPTSGQFIYPV